MPEITIRPPDSPAEYHVLQEAQRLAWGIVEDSYVLPVSTMVSAAHHGGLVLGAFTEDGEAVGVSFGFLGRIEGRICLYSQITGVIPSHQGSGLGTRMKAAQRDFCRREGIDFIAWAFDPMQAGNAWFNLQRLGATARRFIPDMYGPRTDALNAGVPTDRIIAEWEIDASPPPELTPDEFDTLPRAIRPPQPGSMPSLLGLDGPRFLLEVPAEIATLRIADRQLAEGWRVTVGQAMQAAFEDGYRAVGFVRGADRPLAPARYFYVIER